jgi:hypothetical protein
MEVMPKKITKPAIDHNPKNGRGKLDAAVSGV